jgi:hypothetical protein
MKIVTTCPITQRALYVSDIKPSLIQRGAKGDWGYSTKAEQAVDMGVACTDACLRDMRATGRKPVVIGG